MDLNKATTQAMTQQLSILSDPNQDIDSPNTSGETTYSSENWPKYNGYYRTNRGGTKAKIDKFAMWAIGKGYDADEATSKILNQIRGNGKDSFNSIMENQIRVKKINGDSFAHIIRDKTIIDKAKNIANKITLGFVRYAPGSGTLLNLKPLNPSRTRVVFGEDGMILRYEQMDMTGKKVIKIFNPNEIFHLINDREADEGHGISIYEGIAEKLDKIQQLDNDMSTVFHRYVMPLMKFALNTDDPTKISKFKAKAKTALEGGDPLFIPMGAVEADALSIPQFATLDPLKWRESWGQDSVMDIGIPELVLGRAAGVTEASAKVVYLSFQQTVEDEQREDEEQLLLQLGIELKYEFPARIEENLGKDEGKDGKINTGKRSEVKITSKKLGKGTGDPV